jgi:hypothetical protein
MSSITGTGAIGKALDNISPWAVTRLIKLGWLKTRKMPAVVLLRHGACRRKGVAQGCELKRTGEVAKS